MFAQNIFELLANLSVAAVVNSIGVKNENVSWTHQRELAEIRRVKLCLSEVQGVVFLAIRMICGDLQTKGKKLRHSAFIDIHELAIFRREHQRGRMPEIGKAKITAWAYLAV